MTENVLKRVAVIRAVCAASDPFGAARKLKEVIA